MNIIINDSKIQKINCMKNVLISKFFSSNNELMKNHRIINNNKII